jgi:hypothetical protein
MEAFLKALKQYLSSLRKTDELLVSASQYKEGLEEYLTEIVKNSGIQEGSFAIALRFYEDENFTLSLHIENSEVYFFPARPFEWLPKGWAISQIENPTGTWALFTLTHFLNNIPRILERLKELEETENEAQKTIKNLLSKIRKAITPFLISKGLSDLEESYGLSKSK